VSTASRAEQEKAFIEQVGIQLEEFGFPRMAGRVLGWLLLCSPPHQRAADLVRAIGGSKGAISTSLGMLLRFELVERMGIPGERSAYYQVKAGSWTDQMESRISRMTAMRKLAERGLELLADDPPERRRRLEEIRDMHLFFEQEWPAMIARYRRSRTVSAPAKGRRR
jgi:DNA-binding transcriptional regulator GbsR (MarR family)